MERHSVNRGVSKATGINHRSSKAALRKIPHVSQLLKVTISYRHRRFLFPRVGLPWCLVVWPITASGEWKKHRYHLGNKTEIPTRAEASKIASQLTKTRRPRHPNRTYLQRFGTRTSEVGYKNAVQAQDNGSSIRL
jgi:hypothetical protein